ncbi:YegP family protein [Gilvimarinus sp. SDUM040013]|uniref:YegP family protein n=1 Tax=Gilvimarinus gilvus TaxID=3058038 RepID=A0ABU4RZH3_9GAMM|nr:YegP family protein [Gilvimarinus sp. SDUM040013]MDO3388125.1 YegP family protein [Gilvimarinus sp. SDUM040013]MDX6850300.1 YegP family protein [Gilvimarinus sp. SDUM040013]
MLSGAENGIASVRHHSPDDRYYDRKTSTSGDPYFNLKASNGQVIGTSEMYSSTSARETGINSVKTNGPVAPIVDLT